MESFKIKAKFKKTKSKIIFTAILALALLVLLFFSKSRFSQKESTQTTTLQNITQEQAVTLVKNLPEVQRYLKDVPGGLVNLDHEDEEVNTYVIQVYELKNGHSATFNWYQVNKSTGGITKDFN